MTVREAAQAVINSLDAAESASERLRLAKLVKVLREALSKEIEVSKE